MRVVSDLAERGVRFETLPHAPAFGASRRARALRTPGRFVAKPVLLAGPDGFLLAVVRSTQELALKELSNRRGLPFRLARHDDLARLFPDCERGAVPAFGRLYGLPTLLDAGIAPDEDLVFPIGSHFLAVAMTCREFDEITGAVRVELAAQVSPQ